MWDKKLTRWSNKGEVMSKKHPIQPLIVDDNGVIRFKANAIVRYLLDNGGIDLNQITVLDFSREDREQFAQLIGYSLNGAEELDYVSREVIETAEAMRESGKNELESRAAYRQAKLDEVRRAMRPAIAELFDVGEDFDE